MKKIIFTFFVLVGLNLSHAAEKPVNDFIEKDRKANHHGHAIIKGRGSDPAYKKDYEYLNYLADILQFGVLKKSGQVEAWGFRDLTDDGKALSVKNIFGRIRILMVGGAAGLKKRAEKDIDPDRRWRAVQTIKLMAQVNQLLFVGTPEAAHAYDFSTFFTTQANDNIKRNDISDADYQKHIDILNGLGTAAQMAATYHAELSAMITNIQNGGVNALNTLPEQQNQKFKAVLDDIKKGLENLDEDTKNQRLGGLHNILFSHKWFDISVETCRTFVEEQLEAKNLNPAILERVKFYSTHYGLYDHHPVLVKETQLKRLGDIMTYRQAKNLPTRLALGVSNNLGNAQERRRFKDPSWIVADNDVSMLNPAGQAYIVHFIDRVPSMQQLTMWAHKTSHFFDEIVIDKDVHHLIRDFNRIAMIKSILCLKPGGTFQFPLPKPGLGMPKYRRDAPIEDGLPINDAFLEKLLTNPLNIIEQQSYFVGLPIEGQPILRTQRMDFKIFPFLSLPESYFNSDETLAKINHIFLKWFVPYLKKNLTKNNDEPNGLGQDLFSTVDILENQKHHMDIYEGPVDRLFIGTR